MITEKVKQQIVAAMKSNQAMYPSAAKFAASLGVSSSQYSRIINGDIEQVLSDAKWINIARKLSIEISGNANWTTARTTTFDQVTAQLKACQEFALGGILCDHADIGKTHAARHFVKNSPNAIYVDCSQVKSRQKLIRLMAKEFGVDYGGKYKDVYEDLVYYIRSISSPLVVLDEVGDLEYSAFLELKALWNATERFCGWYMMGADGLKVKIESNLDRKKVGYAEIFSRFGGRYQRISPEGKDAFETFKKEQMVQIASVNHIDIKMNDLYAKTQGSLRRVFIESQKIRQAI